MPAAGAWAEPARGLARPRLMSTADRWLASLGAALSRHQRTIRAVQWGVIAVYLVLVAVPAFLDLPPRTAAAVARRTGRPAGWRRRTRDASAERWKP